MENISRNNSDKGYSWLNTLMAQAQSSPMISLGLVLALFAVTTLLTQGLYHFVTGLSKPEVLLALAAGSAGFLTTSIGAAPALIVKNIPQRIEDSLLGFAAGMMLAAAAFSLIIPGIDAGTTMLEHKTLGAGVVVIGLALGVLLMLGLDYFTPHEHDKTGPCGPGHERCGRVWLFVFAIALHNLPEGMAMGVGFAQGDMSVGLPLSTAIALQDIPEGLAVALTLRAVGIKPTLAVLVAAATGLLEPLGAIIGVSLSSGLALAYPIGLGLAAGAMIFVVSHEVIPETHRNGHQTFATIGLMIGFAVMMMLDTTLG
ncbi:ZIP family metal transporter [Methylotenera sp.]|uniref:ZIP family metal transporter n=1 Tax=Methylotenera sp. TaxID=2051956 RepID=UPI00273506D1|nr:ZIP family metal transporter [Methylotenera sp.]MDP3212137.1 ZIP family metal transporter [Methylotenera sp.]MDP3309076.1 ZIP family metal transporter [Methylotenera sp.]